MPPGCTESAPILMEASIAVLMAARLSVKGTKTMFAGFEVAAFCDKPDPAAGGSHKETIAGRVGRIERQ